MAAKKTARKAAASKKPAGKPAASKKATGNTRPARPARRAVVRAAPSAGVKANGPALQHEVEQFLYRQAELLDGKRWQDYIDLFTDDAVYWMPADPAHEHWDGVPSIFAEDRNLMTVRKKRVLHPDAWSQRPLWGTSHVIGNVVIDPRDPKTGDIVVRSRFHMMELRRDNSRHFAGTYLHHLVRTPNGLKVRHQRVDMVNGQAAFDYVLQVWV